MLKLVVCEKPSVAQSISKVLGATKRGDGFLEGGGYIVSWCVGHLVELAQPESYEERYAKWRKEDLPILPHSWKYQVTAATKKQFSVLKKLMSRSDVESLVCATDAGREGELIFRLVYHQCECKKPFERLWISSMEDTAIREGFANLKPGIEYDALYEAALCRERADWIVGINATRLFSCLYGVTLNVGRVMTPTLGMVVLREAAISAFMPEPFYTVQITVNDFAASSERFKEKTDAESCRKACQEAETATVCKVERREKSEKSPALYDLTTLQREANRLFGFTAQQTLDYTQSLYEKKLVTYPRTDSRYLTEDMAVSLPGLAENSALAFGVQPPAAVHASAVINGKKVTDHHALLPTASMAKADLAALPAGEQSVLRMIVARLLAAVSEPHRYAETAVELSCAGTVFSAKGKEILDDGWKEVERQLLPKEEKAVKVLPPLAEGEALPIEKTEIKEGKTSPPKHFTEDLLLQAMEAASADDFPEDAERKGIGTSATRAAIIEKLVLKGFLERKGSGKVKTLIPTEKGKALITVTPEQLQSPAMTADWEEKLSEVEHGEYAPETFMDEISGMIMELVNNYEIVKGAKVLMPGTTVIGTCPHCGAEVIERQKGWFCSNRECRFILWKDNAYFKKIGKRLTAQMAERLVRDGRIRVKDCKSQKTGKTYNASVLLSTEADGRPKFQLEFESGGGGK
ncbi:MAG: DNA topoisomerase 3 [Neglectibacter timonensis]|nr:DNA topoisomerase 3 [Blautia sp.]